MEVKRVLVCTTGNDTEFKDSWPADRTVFSAIKNHPHDKIVALVDPREQDCKTITKLKDFYSNRPDTLEIIAVDTLDFLKCYHKVQDVLEKNKSHEVTINISGGKKILAVAAMLCAFNNGIPIYHYEAEVLTRFPVIRGVSVFEKFTEHEIKVIIKIKNGMTSKALIKALNKDGMSEDEVTDQLLKLKNRKLLRTEVHQGNLKVYLTNEGLVLNKILPRSKR